MFIDSEHDTRFVMEGSEQLFLDCLSPGWLECTFFSCILLFRGNELRGKPTGYHWRGHRFKGSSKRRCLRSLYRESSQKLHSGTDLHGSPLCFSLSCSRLSKKFVEEPKITTKKIFAFGSFVYSAFAFFQHSQL